MLYFYFLFFDSFLYCSLSACLPVFLMYSVMTEWNNDSYMIITTQLSR